MKIVKDYHDVVCNTCGDKFLLLSTMDTIICPLCFLDDVLVITGKTETALEKDLLATLEATSKKVSD